MFVLTAPLTYRPALKGSNAGGNGALEYWSIGVLGGRLFQYSTTPNSKSATVQGFDKPLLWSHVS